MCGDFNAMDQTWRYTRSNAKERSLAQEALEINHTFITEPACPTRIDNSVSRDTTPNLKFVKNDEPVTITWRNTGGELGSDHTIVEIILPTSGEQLCSRVKYT